MDREADGGGDSVSVAGAWAVPYRRVPLSRSAVSWPFGRISVEDDVIVLAGAGLLRYVIPGKTIPLAAVDEIVALSRGSFDPREDVLYIRSKDPRFEGITITSTTGEMRVLVRALRRGGVRVI